MFSAQKLLLRLRALFQRDRASRELDDEIQFHLDQQIAENVAHGMTPENARYAAQRTFGNSASLKEETRDTWGWMRFEQFARSLLHSLRTLRRTPGFAMTAVLVMALGIGATTALFTIVHSVLLQPLPYKDPERLIRLYEHSSDDKFPHNSVAPGIFAEWEKKSRSFSDLAILDDGEAYSLSAAGGQLPEKVRSVECSWNLFSTLGVTPAIGRDFSPSDDNPSANGTVILSWALWQRRFGGDPAVVGQAVHLDAKTYTVIGVMPGWFAYPSQAVQLWLPLYHQESPKDMEVIDSHDFLAIGRLKPGVPAAAATAPI